MEPFRVHILGCASAMPTLRHNPSSQVVEFRDKLYMVDCAEGTQLQMRRYGLSFSRVAAIFISHLHGDHCLGLVGMLSTFGMLGRKMPIQIYADAALRPVLDAQVKAFCHGLGYPVEFHPVDCGTQQPIYEDGGVVVESIPLEHRVPCCGFLFREKRGLPHIRRDMLDYHGISVSQINNIKRGADGIRPDGTAVPHCLLTTPPAEPRTYAYCSDTRYIPTLHKRIPGVGLLYHESTYADDKQASAAEYYHSTARQAATVARDAGAARLLLGHFSARYDDCGVFKEQAAEVFPDVELADEGLVFDIV